MVLWEQQKKTLEDPGRRIEKVHVDFRGDVYRKYHRIMERMRISVRRFAQYADRCGGRLMHLMPAAFSFRTRNAVRKKAILEIRGG